MKAIIKQEKSKGFNLVEIESPKIINAYDVKLRIIYSSICGTDVHIWKWDEWAQKQVKTPHINGHEGIGQVIEIGTDVTNVNVGDYVGYETHYYCRNCKQCRSNHQHICKNVKILGVNIDGIWREEAILPEWLLFKIPNDTKIPIKYFTFLEPLGSAHYTLSYGNLKNKNVLIQGDGPIGILAILVAKAKGAKNAILSGWGDTIRKKVAKQCGITFIDRKELISYEDFYKKLKKITNNEGIDFIGEFSGNINALQDAVKIIDRGGKISILSIYSKNNFEVDFNSLVVKNATLQFICGRKIFDTWNESFELINSKKINLKHIDKLITHEYDFKNFEKGFQEIVNGKACKVLLNVSTPLKDDN